MNENTRFAILVVVVIVIVAVAGWGLLGGDEAPPEEAAPPAVIAEAEPELEAEAEASWEAPLRPPARSAAETEAPVKAGGVISRKAAETPVKARGVIHGRVTGAPASEVTVRLHYVNWKAREPIPDDALLLVVYPEADGSYHFDSLAFGKYMLEAMAAGKHRRFDITLNAKRANYQRNIALRNITFIAGRVIDPSGAGVPGASILPASYSTGGREVSLQATTSIGARAASDERGEFVMPNLNPSVQYSFVVRAEGFATYISEYLNPDTRSAVFQLSRGGSASGVARHRDGGQPAAGFLLQTTAKSEIAIAQARTDGEGRFEFAGLTAGEHSLALIDSYLVVTRDSGVFTVRDGIETSGLVVEVAPGVVVSGRVYDADSGRGIPNVEMRALPQGFRIAREASAATGAGGVYEIGGLPEGVYTVSHEEAKGYPQPRGRTNKKTVHIAAGAPGVTIDFPLSHGIQVMGIVVGMDDEPIADVSVSSNQDNGGHRDSTRTDERGQFVLSGFKANTSHQIRARKDGLAARRTRNLRVPEEGIRDLRIQMQEGASISGIVVDTHGRPMPSIQFLVPPVPNQIGGNRIHQTEADGSFEVSSLVEGTYAIIFWRSGANTGNMTPAKEVPVRRGEQVTGVRVVFEGVEGLTITGRITNARGEGVTGARIQAQGGSWADATSGRDGHFEVIGLSDATYRLTFEHAAYTTTTLVGIGAGTTGLTVEMRGRGAVRGRVVNAATGEPVPDFQLYAAKGRHAPDPWRAFAPYHDPEGRFTLPGIEEGDTTIHARAIGFAPNSAFVSGVVQDGQVDGVLIRLAPGNTLNGRTVNSSGEPISGAQIFVGEAPQYNREYSVRATTGPDGAFTLDSLPSGTVMIGAVHANYAPTTAPVFIESGRPNEADIVLMAGGALNGRVTLAGAPMPSVNVHTYSSSNGNRFNQSASTDDDGYFEFTGLSDGMFRISANFTTGGTQRSRSMQAEVAAEHTTTVDFAFDIASASVEGYVYRSEGETLSGARVMISVTTGGATESRSTVTDAQGFYQFADLTAGTGSIRVWAEGLNTRRQFTVDLREGERVQRDLLLYGGGTIRIEVRNAPSDSAAVVCVVLRGEVEIPELSQAYFGSISSITAGSAQPDANGFAEITGLDPGAYTVLALAYPNPQEFDTPEEMFAQARFATQIVLIEGENQQRAIVMRF